MAHKQTQFVSVPGRLTRAESVHTLRHVEKGFYPPLSVGVSPNSVHRPTDMSRELRTVTTAASARPHLDFTMSILPVRKKKGRTFSAILLNQPFRVMLIGRRRHFSFPKLTSLKWQLMLNIRFADKICRRYETVQPIHLFKLAGFLWNFKFWNLLHCKIKY